MSETLTSRDYKAITVLQWTLGLVVLIEAGLFVLGPHAGHDFAKTHMPQVIRLVLGWGEIVAAILFLIPRTAVRGAWLLLVIFVLAIAIHLLHGTPNVGALVVYAAVAWTVATVKSKSDSEGERSNEQSRNHSAV
jgi:cell division protein FtsW (lipid II flippase)